MVKNSNPNPVAPRAPPAEPQLWSVAPQSGPACPWTLGDEWRHTACTCVHLTPCSAACQGHSLHLPRGCRLLILLVVKYSIEWAHEHHLSILLFIFFFKIKFLLCDYLRFTEKLQRHHEHACRLHPASPSVNTLQSRYSCHTETDLGP